MSFRLSPRRLRQMRQEDQWSTYLLAEEEQLCDPAWCVSNGIPPSGLLDDIEYNGKLCVELVIVSS